MGKIKNSQIKKNKKVVEDELLLDDVLALGGSKADFQLLQGINDENEDFNYKEDKEVGAVQKEELRNFIKELGFESFKEKEDSGEPRKVKLLKMPESEEQKEERSKTELTKKKKNKNKYKAADEGVTAGEVTSMPSTSFQFIDNYEPRTYLLVKPGGKWFDQSNDDPTLTEKLSKELTLKLKAYAEKVMTSEAALYKKQQEQSTGFAAKWRKKVLKSGTSSDKVAALTLTVQDSPLHNLQEIDNLVGMTKKKGRREALSALGTLKELWLSDLLLENRKLRKFDENPLSKVNVLASGNKDTRDKTLLLWYFEDHLKQIYEGFVKALELWSKDQITAPKKKVMNVVLELLAGKPEQEQLLLEVIINKLGDPDRKVASHAALLLSKLVKQHSNMKMVVCAEVERFMYRKNISQKAQYFSICFLNQTLLSHAENKLATKLLDIYFSFFKLFAKNTTVESKMLSALLTGVNRAFPFAKEMDLKTLDEQLNTVYKTVHTAQFNTGVQALMLLHQVVDPSNAVMCDRYYQALYRKLIDPELRISSRQEMLLNVLYKSLKKDDSVPRIKAFVKRLLQVCSHMPPTFICGSLILVSEILKVKPKLLTKVTAEQETRKEGGAWQKGGAWQEDEDSDEEEQFTDVRLEGEEAVEDGHTAEVKKVLRHNAPDAASSWVHRKNIVSKQKSEGLYDPLFRNPMYCRAEQEVEWELEKLAQHYHPTVVLFSHSLLKGEKIEYSGDPLHDFLLIRFLDRFVYRNPKKSEKSSVSSLEPRRKGASVEGTKAVNEDKYKGMKAEDVPVEEQFYYKYFSEQTGKRKQLSDDEESEAESVSDDEFDAFLDKYEAQFDGGETDVKFDFAGEFDKGKQTHKKRKLGEMDSDSDEVDLSDEEVDFDEDDFDFEEKEMDFEGEDMDEDGGEDMDDGDLDNDGDLDDDLDDDGDSDDDEEDNVDYFNGPKKSSKSNGVAAMKRKHGNFGNLFVSADEVGHLFDENTGSRFDFTGSEAVSNKDNAHAKQLKWESDRDKKTSGKTWNSKKKQKYGSNKWKSNKGWQKKGKSKFGNQKHSK